MAIQQHHMPLLLLTFLLAASSRSHGLADTKALATSPLINSTCTAAGNSTWFTPYAYCVRTLSAIPAAASATDARGLGVVAANLTVTNVTTTIQVLTDLVGALQKCIGSYRVLNKYIEGAFDDLKANRTDAALMKFKGAPYKPSFCNLALEESKTKKNPVWEENKSNEMLAGLANDILALVARKKAR